jgi:ATP-dependent Clp protease ATP-binding subunit ClpC
MGVTGAAMGNEVKSLLLLARDAARARKQPFSTAHVLIAMAQSGGECAELLGAYGVRERELLSAIKVVGEESEAQLDIVVERTMKLARLTGDRAPTSMHLLLVLASEPRTAAHRCLESIGTPLERFHASVAERVGVVVGRAESDTVGAASQASASVAPSVVLGPREGRPPGNRRILQPIPGSASPRSHSSPRTGAAMRLGQRTAPSSTSASTSASTSPLGAPAPAPKADPCSGGAPGAVDGDAGPRRDRALPDPAPPEAALSATASTPFDLDPRQYPLLSALGRNLTALAWRGALDPVIGREREVEAVLDVLARRRANNPLLVGPPGVGKTAIVEGLAVAIAAHAPATRALEGRVLLEVSGGALTAGTGVRGALADKLARLRAEVARAEGRVLLFLDEFHTLVGSEGAGPDDLASELKASLARGELPCIAATTDAEYKRYIERDAALSRRFTRIEVAEPSPESCVRIVRSVLPRYEAHHGVRYDPEAVDQAVSLSIRFLVDRQLPDKALSVLDLAGARTRRRGGEVVDIESVARVISEQAHVPLERLLLRDRERLLALEAHLSARIVGQRVAIRCIADALRKGAAGFRGKRPLGTFLLLGPTGVGKTETAKAISEVLFGSSDFTRLDMSEYAEAHAVARLLGAPPGYVGHDEGGQLTEAVRRRPYQLVLLDEIEKAHPDVLLALLPLLDEGRLTDGRGRTVDFTHTVIVMTSNLGVAAVRERRAVRPIGFGVQASAAAGCDAAGGSAEAERALAEARRALPPEFWNRIDEPLWFAPLGRDEVRTIARRMLARVAQVLATEHAIDLRIDETALDTLVDAGGFDPELGARPMRRTVGRLVESPLAERLLAGELVRGDVVRLRGHGATLVFERGDRDAAANSGSLPDVQARPRTSRGRRAHDPDPPARDAGLAVRRG